MDGQALDPLRPSTTITQLMERFGYRPLETPVIDEAALFLTRAGDRIASRLFTFHRNGVELALRPEFTSQAAHHYLRNGFGGVQRWQFAGPVFEDDPDNKSEFQRHSVGAELFGLTGPAADAEIMALALTVLQRMGVEDWQLVVGHIGLMRQMLARFQLDERTERFLINNLRALRQHGVDHVLRKFEVMLAGKGNGTGAAPDTFGSREADAVDTGALLARLLDATRHGVAMGGRSHQDIARRLLRKHQHLGEREQVLQALQALEHWSRVRQHADQAFRTLADLTPRAALPLLQEWQESVELLACYGLPTGQITIQPDLARTWDYYSGLVFELHTPAGLHLGGGGRYDELLSFLGAAEPVPAVGFACWLDGPGAGSEDCHASRTATVLLDGANGRAATGLVRMLRGEGLNAELVSQANSETLRPDVAGNVSWRGQDFNLAEPGRLLEALRNG